MYNKLLNLNTWAQMTALNWSTTRHVHQFHSSVECMFIPHRDPVNGSYLNIEECGSGRPGSIACFP